MGAGQEKKPIKERIRASRTFLTILSSSIALILALTGIYVYVSDITSDVTIQIDNKIAPCQSREETVGDVLSDIGFKVGEYDIVEPSLDTVVNDDTDIRVQRVEKKKEKVEEATEFKTVKEDDASLNKGTSEVAQNGKKGKDLVTYLVTYTSGKETAREDRKKSGKNDEYMGAAATVYENIDAHITGMKGKRVKAEILTNEMHAKNTFDAPDTVHSTTHDVKLTADGFGKTSEKLRCNDA